jgi:hypothetical protein
VKNQFDSRIKTNHNEAMNKLQMFTDSKTENEIRQAARKEGRSISNYLNMVYRKYVKSVENNDSDQEK